MLDALRIIRLASRILAPRPPFRFVAKCVPSSVYARLDLDRLLQQRQRLVGGLGHRDRNIGKGARVEPRHWHMLRTARLVTIAFGDGSGPQHVDCLIDQKSKDAGKPEYGDDTCHDAPPSSANANVDFDL